MNPTSKTTTITIAGKKYELYFDLNTFSAFEQVTGRFFTDFLMDIREAFLESKEKKDQFILFRRIPVKDVRALVWAALHTYNSDDEPQWPMTINKLGRVLDISQLQNLLPAIMEGNAENAPDVKEESEESGTDRPPETALSNPESGGDGSGPSDADVLGSLELNSGD